MELLFLLLAQSAAYRGGLLRVQLEHRMRFAGHRLQDLRFHSVHCNGVDDWLVRHADGRLLFHPLMERRRIPRQPRLPNRWNKTRSTCTRRMEHRRNRRSERTFVHAAPIVPATRAPRVAIPPW